MSNTDISPNISSLEPIVSLAKRRGFIFPSSEIYGGIGSCYDYGPLGAELKRNVKEAWWKSMVHLREDVVGLDASIIMHPDVWRASGHVDGFTDPLVECENCGRRVREDHLVDGKWNERCPKTKKDCIFGQSRAFNLMFKTNLGPVEDSAHCVYLRPETAQGIFVNFLNVCDSTRVKLPFGIAQQGKSFRNEITTRHFTFRTCEFEQMEMEYFCRPEEMENLYKFWCDFRLNWFTNLGVSPERLRLRPHADDELAHYSSACSDIEYLFPFGWSELEGIACRGDYDLKKHAEHSGKKLIWRDQQTNETIVPYVVEPALGTDRALLTFLVDAYCEEEIDGNSRTVLKLDPKLAPYSVAVFPLLRKDGHPEKAREVFKQLQSRYNAIYDDSGNIGRRYRRQDEIGTPICITVDHDSIKNHTVTLRDRDTLEQTTVTIEELPHVLLDKLGF